MVSSFVVVLYSSSSLVPFTITSSAKSTSCVKLFGSSGCVKLYKYPWWEMCFKYIGPNLKINSTLLEIKNEKKQNRKAFITYFPLLPFFYLTNYIYKTVSPVGMIMRFHHLDVVAPSGSYVRPSVPHENVINREKNGCHGYAEDVR